MVLEEWMVFKWIAGLETVFLHEFSAHVKQCAALSVLAIGDFSCVTQIASCWKERPTKAKMPLQFTYLTVSQFPSAVSPVFVSTFHWMSTFKENEESIFNIVLRNVSEWRNVSQHQHCWLWYRTLQMLESVSFPLCVFHPSGNGSFASLTAGI